MRLGIGSYTYTWAIGVPGHGPAAPMHACDLLARAGALGVRVVQICDNIPLDALDDAALTELVTQATALDIQIEVGTRGLQYLPHYLRIARHVGSPIVRAVIDTPDDHPPLDEVVRRVANVMPAFEAAGITLAIENHDRFTTRQFVALLTDLASPWVGICLDTVNSFGALEGPEVVVERLAPWTVNLHVKDFAVTRVSSQMGFTVEGRPAGRGRLDVPWLLAQLRAAGRDPNAILELWTPPADTLDETIAREARWAEESVAYLRTLIPD